MHLMPENLVEIFRLRNVIFRSKIKTPSITFQWERDNYKNYELQNWNKVQKILLPKHALGVLWDKIS